MPKTIRVATIQMNAQPAPLRDRLARAETLVAQAAQAGAELVVLPEVFNTGYEYSPQNYARAEPLDGPTPAWMRKTAAGYHIHLAGSFLHAQENRIHNTLLLVAPDGQEWRYDKNYPWVWERAYFEPGRDITAADTALGKIGFLICWDVAHPALWQKYAGKVQLMVVCSCPPNAFDLTFVFPDGTRLLSQNTGPLVQMIKRASDPTFGDHLRRQACALGVPVAQATSTGLFSSSLPGPAISLAFLSLMYPPLLKYASRFAGARIESGYFNETYLADPAGTVLQRMPPGQEGFALSPIALSDAPAPAKQKQPAFGIPASAYLLDMIANRLLASEYRRHTGRHSGPA